MTWLIVFEIFFGYILFNVGLLCLAKKLIP
jgi:hypothetical protein